MGGAENRNLISDMNNVNPKKKEKEKNEPT